ncbi:MAG TPA: single-stranded DNA-binding protein [Bacteroidia bacterium]|nr:single-stranded DNA-binding protein [Bacteroidia bacterium]
MSGLNKVMLIGNIGKDPEIRHLEGGNMMAKFPLATNEIYKTKDGLRREITEWHNIVVWQRLAETIEKLQLKKGQLLYVEGRIRSRTWDDKDGHKHYATEIVADGMTILGRKITDGQPDDHHITNDSDPINGIQAEVGDLPF